MRHVVNISSKHLDEVEAFISEFYAPVKLRRLGRPSDSPIYGATGYVSQIGEVSFEWTRAIGTAQIDPLTDFDSLMFKFCRSGGVQFELNSGTHVNSPGTAMAFCRPKSLQIEDGTVHSTVTISKRLILRRLTAMFDRPVIPDIGFLEQPLGGQLRVDALSGFVHQWFESPLLNLGRSLAEKSDSLANLIADSFLLAYPSNYSELLAGPVPSVSPKHVKRALDYIHSNPQVHSSPEHLAQLSNVSLRSLQYSFRATTGQTITEYQMQLRLSGARQQMLQYPRMSLTEVAENWGFGSLTRFGQTFRSAFGETPSDFRRRTKGQL